MKKISRILVALFALFLTQSSLGTKADLINARSISQNGYKKYEDGMLIQWGRISNPGESRVIYLPCSFLDEYYSLNTGFYRGSYQSYDAVFCVSIRAQEKDKFTVRTSYIYDMSDRGYSASGSYVSWFAVGKWK